MDVENGTVDTSKKDDNKTVDDDKDMQVSAEEWLTFCTRVYEGLGGVMAYDMLEVALQGLFESAMMDQADALHAMLDRDHSGELDYAEVSALFPPPPSAPSGKRPNVLDSPATTFLNYVDKDYSGTLDLQEWRDFILAGWRNNPSAAHAFCLSVRARAKEAYGI